MKRLFFLLSFLLLAWSAFSQSVTLTDLVGKFTFQSFSAGGTSDVTGTLDAFSDQTNQYFANNIQVGDVIWDNQGNRWEVMVINSANLLQADVDLRNVNSVGGTPIGVGFVSRETPNMGLSLFVPDNNIGISQQLKSRIESHNMLLIDQYVASNRDSVFTGATAADTSTVTDPAVGDVLVANDGYTAYYNGDSWVVSGTWLKPELQTNDVNISNSNNLTFSNGPNSVTVYPSFGGVEMYASDGADYGYLAANGSFGNDSNGYWEFNGTGFYSKYSQFSDDNSVFLGHSGVELISETLGSKYFGAVRVHKYGTDNALISLMSSNGTNAGTGSAITIGKILGEVEFGGNKDGTYISSTTKGISAWIRSVATENFNTSATGGEIQFHVTPNGATSPLQSLTIGNNGILSLDRYTGVASTTAPRLLGINASNEVVPIDTIGLFDGNGIYSGSGNIPDGTEATLADAGSFAILDNSGGDRLRITEEANIAITATTGFTATTTSGILGLTHTGSSGQLIIQSQDERATFQGEDTRINGDTVITLNAAAGGAEMIIKDNSIQLADLPDDNAPVKFLGVDSNHEIVESDVVLTATNGLNDADPGSLVDIELGGDLEKNTVINGNNYRMTWDTLNDFYITGLQDELRVTTDTLGNRHAELVLDVGTSFLEMQNWNTDSRSEIKLQQTGEVLLTAETLDGSSGTSIFLDKDYIVISGVPVYADDAAADADVLLGSGGIYQVTGDRTLRIKP